MYAVAAIFCAIFAVTVYLYVDTMRSLPSNIKDKLKVATIEVYLKVIGFLKGSMISLGLLQPFSGTDRWLTDIACTGLHLDWPWSSRRLPEIEVEDRMIDHKFAVRIYRPAATLQTDLSPVVVYFHGGGWSLLSVDSYDTVVRRIAQDSGVVVISVNYRLSPQHPFPTPLDDCVLSVEYVIQNAALLKVDSNRIAVAGDSAGGNLAAAVSLRLKKKIKLQLLLVPVLQCFNFKTSSFVENAKYFSKTTNNVFQVIFWLNYLGLPPYYQHAFLSNNHTSATLKNSKYASYVDQNKWMKEKYIRNPILMSQSSHSNDFGDREISKRIKEKILNQLIAPLMADDANLENLPTTYIMTAGYDLIRDDGIMYAHRLMHAGVKTHLINIPNSFHIAFTFVDCLLELELGRKTVKDIVDFIKHEL